MGAGFLTIGGLCLILGLVFLIWPRTVEQSVRDLFSIVGGGGRSQRSARLGGAILCGIGLVAIVYGATNVALQ